MAKYARPFVDSDKEHPIDPYPYDNGLRGDYWRMHKDELPKDIRKEIKLQHGLAFEVGVGNGRELGAQQVAERVMNAYHAGVTDGALVRYALQEARHLADIHPIHLSKNCPDCEAAFDEIGIPARLTCKLIENCKSCRPWN